MVKVVPWPGRLSTLSRPPIAAISERASNAPIPKPPGLGRGEGLEQAVADEVAVHAGAVIGDRDATPIALAAANAHGHRVLAAARLDRVLEEMADRLLERGRHRPCAHRLASPSSLTSWSPRLAAIAAVRIARSGCASTRWTRAEECGASRASRSFILPTELCSVATMSARNSGLSACRSALRGEQRQLADQILDVVQDEGEAAVEFLEPLGVGERLLALRLGERARRLAAGGAKQVEILPVERPAIFGRGEQRRGRSAARGGSAECRSTPRRRRASMRGTGKALVARRSPSRRAAPSNSRIRPLLSTAFQNRAHLRARRGGGLADGQFHEPAIVERRARPSLTSSRPPGASTMSAKALTIRSAERRARRGPMRPSVSVKRSHSLR